MLTDCHQNLKGLFKCLHAWLNIFMELNTLIFFLFNTALRLYSMLFGCFDLMRRNILIWISLILNIFNYFSLTVKRILTPTFFFLSLEYFFWDIWGEPQQFLVRATFYPFSRPSQLGILVLRLLCVLKFTILEDKTIFKKSGHVRA